MRIPSKERGCDGKIKTLDEAVGKEVMCTDGFVRRLNRVDTQLGFYQIQKESLSFLPEIFVDLSLCSQMFIGGSISEDVDES